jgi:hypothetical protein
MLVKKITQVVPKEQLVLLFWCHHAPCNMIILPNIATHPLWQVCGTVFVLWLYMLQKIKGQGILGSCALPILPWALCGCLLGGVLHSGGPYNNNMLVKRKKK